MTTPAAGRTRQWIVVISVAAALGVAAWALAHFTAPRAVAQVGSPAPAFTLPDVRTGDSVSLEQRYRGHVTLVNIWATWCIPCGEEMPSMQRLYDAYRDRGFRVVATSIDQGDPSGVLQYANRHNLTFDILQDRTMRIQETYQTLGVPESFLLDRNGRIAYIALGAETWDAPDHRQRVEHLLGNP
ncbi:MAG TPA: TlpA disulfide reductase family protein [Gemmatimonadales bacterium]|jgi:peroxiredoxin